MNRARPTEAELDADRVQSLAQHADEAKRIEQAFRNDCKAAGWLCVLLISWIALIALLAYRVLQTIPR